MLNLCADYLIQQKLLFSIQQINSFIYMKVLFAMIAYIMKKT